MEEGGISIILNDDGLSTIGIDAEGRRERAKESRQKNIHTPGAQASVDAMSTADVTALAAELAAGVAATPATAALISASVASSTKRFCVKIHPFKSVATSQVFPLAVGSPIVPGANVPDLRASVGVPPTDAICFASSNTIALLTAAALVEAGSCGWCQKRCFQMGEQNIPDVVGWQQSRDSRP